MERQTIVILDLGGPNNQIIARRVRECNVYCELLPFDADIQTIKNFDPAGIIIAGSVNDRQITLDKSIFELQVPVLGIGQGQLLIVRTLGGKASVQDSKYQKAQITVDSTHSLFEGASINFEGWVNQSAKVDTLPLDFCSLASIKQNKNAAIANDKLKVYGVLFHPEYNNTQDSIKILKNFLFNICKVSPNWTMSFYARNYIKSLREKIGDKKVLCALSGGVDSSVCAVLVQKAIGDNLVCIFVDHGLLRKNEADEVEKYFKDQQGINFLRVNAQDRFLNRLKGIRDPEKKRKIIGEEFIRVFEEQAQKIGEIDYLAQGTIYPDVLESANVKSHHNVGGLPKNIKFKGIIEPLRSLFKDEVRQLGLTLGMPERLVFRQPFPGPGLAVRIIGEVTKQKLDILREADAIFREEISLVGLDKNINQYFAVLTDMRSVGVRDEERTYENILALRAVTTTDFMSAKWAKIPHSVLERVSSRIVNEIKAINRVVYDITDKPPATIEWE
ncbi:MAG TPA: glutamine-hydrolyzing GMP synthase [Clostridiales bacterium]|jgi:GMP synthase (glutamine-hydrolysing)|nr:glutamine-hydrolyzing GMP synthase [Clostridiales bacterium]